MRPYLCLVPQCTHVDSACKPSRLHLRQYSIERLPHVVTGLAYWSVFGNACSKASSHSISSVASSRAAFTSPEASMKAMSRGARCFNTERTEDNRGPSVDSHRHASLD